jgi:polysaccharide deacetylase family protein (PEP-CTERM system associated)
MGKRCIFSIDVEDWFHILDLPSTPDIAEWDALPSRVEKNFHALLDVLDEKKVKATCFFLGYVAKRFPHLVREAVARGHEPASHGYAHRLVYTQTEGEFLEDARRARQTIEDAAGRAVSGYRSSGFSVTDKTPWFFDKVREAGYRYDSSVFPAARGHGGLAGARTEPHVMTKAGDLVEFPITVANVLGKPMCFFGGGYLRLYPYGVIRAMSRRVLEEGRPVVFYVHPREVDPSHPRLPMGRARAFKSYVNLRTTEKKIRRIADDFELTTFEGFLAERGRELAKA